MFVGNVFSLVISGEHNGSLVYSKLTFGGLCVYVCSDASGWVLVLCETYVIFFLPHGHSDNKLVMPKLHHYMPSLSMIAAVCLYWSMFVVRLAISWQTPFHDPLGFICIISALITTSFG